MKRKPALILLGSLAAVAASGSLLKVRAETLSPYATTYVQGFKVVGGGSRGDAARTATCEGGIPTGTQSRNRGRAWVARVDSDRTVQYQVDATGAHTSMQVLGAAICTISGNITGLEPQETRWAESNQWVGVNVTGNTWSAPQSVCVGNIRTATWSRCKVADIFPP